MTVLPWAARYLVKLREAQPELVDRAVARLLDEDSELLWSVVLSAYLDGEINLGKSAELLGLHELELRDRFIELGVPLRTGPANLEEARAEAGALEAWLSHKPQPAGS
ncbi:MAG: hypothetical protein GY719_20165 [bacterium]|nr:hypothetical protein [bacterium]